MSDLINETDFSTREAWLMTAIEHLRPKFAEIGTELPEQVRVSTGWSKNARKGSIGWTWISTAAEDKVSNVFISPEKSDSVEVLGILIHELVHVADDCQHGHGKAFKDMAVALGLEGKMTATVAGEELTDEFEALVCILGDYPHAKMLVGAHGKGSGPKTQTTRMIKLIADPKLCTCEYTVRTSQKWIDEGMPQCPHGETMILG
jgi:SprT-like family